MNHKTRHLIYECISDYFQIPISTARQLCYMTIVGADFSFKMSEEIVWHNIYHSLKTNDERFIKVLENEMEAINKDAELKRKLDKFILYNGIESGELKSFKSYLKG